MECPIPPQADSGPREPVVERSVASEPTDAPAAAEVIGRVKVMQAPVAVISASGKRTPVDVQEEAEVHETDTVEAGTGGTALITFVGGNQVHVHPDTSLEVKEYKNPESAPSRKALLNLIKGKIRNQVKQKYNSETSSYRVMTKAAVAGVRGTDFVVTHSESTSAIETRVETLSGMVVLADRNESESRQVGRGLGAAYVIAAAKDKSVSPFVKRGKFTPVYKISSLALGALDENSRVDVAKRSTAPVEEDICDNPKGLFNQCAWTCKNNPKGEKTCRTDLPQVQCVRVRCNGNGKWSDESRLPAATSTTMCPARGWTVKACDY